MTNQTIAQVVNKPPFKEALNFWLKLGLISFGGPAGQIAIMHTVLVEQKRWISDAKFLHALNYCMLLPGPEAQQLATYVGWLLHGTRGALAAGVLFVLPSVFILLGLSMLYVSVGSIPAVAALFDGLKPAVVAIVMLALVKIGKKSLGSPVHYLVATFSFMGIFILNISFPVLMGLALLVALAGQRWIPNFFTTQTTVQEPKAREEGYYLNTKHTLSGNGFNVARLVKQLGIFIVLWTLPLGIFYVVRSDFTFWKTLCLFFSQAAFVTFGGAYAILPYVAQVSVEKLHWLSNGQMLDGLALGETTPGPLIMVLAFVGFMAGYSHFHGSLWMGMLGLLATTYYTFLPSFLFILAGAPIIEKTQHNDRLKVLLSVVTAAVVGVMLNLTIYFARGVVFPNDLVMQQIDWFSLIWIAVSLVVLYRLKLSLITWIGISAGIGVLRFFITDFIE